MDISVLDCLRCQNPLTLKETKAQEHYCEICRRIVAESERRDLLSRQIEAANRRATKI